MSVAQLPAATSGGGNFASQYLGAYDRTKAYNEGDIVSIGSELYTFTAAQAANPAHDPVVVGTAASGALAPGSRTVPIPSGAQVGDLVAIVGASFSSNYLGTLTNFNPANGDTQSGFLNTTGGNPHFMCRVLTAADVAAGTIGVTISGTGAAAQAAYVVTAMRYVSAPGSAASSYDAHVNNPAINNPYLNRPYGPGLIMTGAVGQSYNGTAPVWTESTTPSHYNQGQIGSLVGLGGVTNNYAALTAIAAVAAGALAPDTQFLVTNSGLSDTSSGSTLFQIRFQSNNDAGHVVTPNMMRYTGGDSGRLLAVLRSWGGGDPASTVAPWGNGTNGTNGMDSGGATSDFVQAAHSGAGNTYNYGPTQLMRADLNSPLPPMLVPVPASGCVELEVFGHPPNSSTNLGLTSVVAGSSAGQADYGVVGSGLCYQIGTGGYVANVVQGKTLVRGLTPGTTVPIYFSVMNPNTGAVTINGFCATARAA